MCHWKLQVCTVAERLDPRACELGVEAVHRERGFDEQYRIAGFEKRIDNQVQCFIGSVREQQFVRVYAKIPRQFAANGFLLGVDGNVRATEFPERLAHRG